MVLTVINQLTCSTFQTSVVFKGDVNVINSIDKVQQHDKH